MNVKKPEGYDFPLNLYRTLCFELDSDARLPEEITPDEKKGFKYLIGSMRNDEYELPSPTPRRKWFLRCLAA